MIYYKTIKDELEAIETLDHFISSGIHATMQYNGNSYDIYLEEVDAIQYGE